MNPKFTWLYSIDERGRATADIVTRRSYKNKRRAKRRVAQASRRKNR